MGAGRLLTGVDIKPNQRPRKEHPMTGTKLQGRTFFINNNNGVTAIVDQLVNANGEKRRALYRSLVESRVPGSPDREEGAEAFDIGLEHLWGTPVFTFADVERVARSPWFTGSSVLLDSVCRYIEKEDGLLIRGRSIFVPFSNGAETGLRGPRPRAQAYELRYVTTEHQFLDTFGATIAEVSKI